MGKKPVILDDKGRLDVLKAEYIADYSAIYHLCRWELRALVMKSFDITEQDIEQKRRESGFPPTVKRPDCDGSP